jgi:hypothetical protein
LQKACLTCGASFTPEEASQRRCPRHRPQHSHRSPTRDRRKQAEFRQAVLDRDGHQCRWLDPDTGERCRATTDLRACHVIPLRDFDAGDPGAYDPENGLTYCGEHDRMTDRYAT